uniref:No apical meristem-associated C-terminal domain-containing protein n=1 Tax=Aegilops tauschii subsp. strangulata TaxID=200361 RepID=A0A453QQR8_AEGTS
MSSEILLFDGMWRRVDDAFTATGQYNQDLVSKSLEMYRLEQNQSFKFLNMWMFIRNYPQWNAMYCRVKKP